MRTSTLVKNFFALAGLAVIIALPSVSRAQSANDIATINIQAILRESAAAKSAKKQIDAKRDTYQAELKKIEDKLRKEDQALAEQRSLLSPEALEQKAREFRTQVTEAQKDVQEKRERLGEAYNKAVGDIQEAVMKIVEKMAAEKGFKVVIPTNNLVYATSELDITKPVLTQLDKNLPKVSIDFNAKPAGK